MIVQFLYLSSLTYAHILIVGLFRNDQQAPGLLPLQYSAPDPTSNYYRPHYNDHDTAILGELPPLQTLQPSAFRILIIYTAINRIMPGLNKL